MVIWHVSTQKPPIDFFHSSILMARGWMVALVGLGIWRFRVVSGGLELLVLCCADKGEALSGA